MLAHRGVLLTIVLATLAIMAPSAAAADPASPRGPATPSDKAGPLKKTNAPTVTPDDLVFQPRTLRAGDPRQVGLLPEQVDAMRTEAARYLEPTADHPNYPSYGGAVVLGAKDGVIVQHAAVGHAMRYSGTRVEEGRTIGVELPRDQWVDMRQDTIFDMASVSKLFCTVVVLQLVESGQLGLDDKVAAHIPDFAANGKGEITVRQLFTHSSGMRAWIPLYSAYDTPEERIAAVYASALQPGAAPGEQYIYSDLGLITLGKLAETLTGKSLDALVAERITGPLGMADTMYNPPAALHHRVAATEEQPWAGRPMIRGEVHDENAWSLGGVAGHAGIFSTAADMAVFSQMLLNGGTYDGARILSDETVRQALVNYNTHIGTSASQRGLGFELNKHWYMGPLASPVGFGHTGYTGTTVTIDPVAHSFVIFLSNRVHPTRNWGGNNESRRAMTYAFGRATPVRPAAGPRAWRADWTDRARHTLTAALASPAQDATLGFALWYDTETGYDTGRLEVSTDGGDTWRLLPFSLVANGHHWTSDGEFTGYQGRQWTRAKASLPDGATHLRWSYHTDGNSQGRGVYVDAVVAASPTGVLLNSETPQGRAAFTPYGWSAASV